MKMTKLLTIIAVLSASCLMAAPQLFIYSPDGKKMGSGARALPVQAVNLSTGKLVLNLQNLDDVARAQCGWYRILPYGGTLASNQVFVATNYIFTAAGTADPIGVVKDKPVPTYHYSKYKIYLETVKLGKWEALEQWMKDTTVEGVNFHMAWTLADYIDSSDPLFNHGVALAAAAMDMNRDEVLALLERCIDSSSRKR